MGILEVRANAARIALRQKKSPAPGLSRTEATTVQRLFIGFPTSYVFEVGLTFSRQVGAGGLSSHGHAGSPT